MARDRLIPFQQVSAFEAAVWHLSFSRAGQELNVLQPAVSRQVAALEEALGTQLFIRTKPRLTLTEEGELLTVHISKGFDSLRNRLAELHNRQSSHEIVVSAAIGFTSLYLLPRLAEFQSKHSEIKVQITTRDQSPDYDLSRCDAVVVFGSEGLKGLPSSKIFSEQMVAVYQPEYLGARCLEHTELAKERLLYMTSPGHAGD